MIAAAVAIALAFQSVGGVSPNTLRKHVEFLASDKLEGRDTPSAGLDLAAAYIAGEFKAIGLKPLSDGSYFQSTEYENRRKNLKAKVSNVIGVLPGTDPALKDRYVIVSAHYDHLGKREGEGDTIFNGANDDASGVAGVIETARVLAKRKLKRTVVFMCFYGEEKGLVGSRYYAQHPVFPVAQTVANINLEQIGRTDDSEGPRVGKYNLTGFDFTDLPKSLGPAAAKWSVSLEKHPTLNEPYFMASDNYSFAAVGIPCTTISVAYEFPDYHRVGDHADRLDYPNFAKIVRAIAEGVEAVSNGADDPKWNKDNPKAKRFSDLRAGG